MFLTDEQASRFRAHLQAAQVRGDCPTCKKPCDLVQNAAIATRMYLDPGWQRVRVVECVCPHCAVISAFSASAIDL